MRHVIHTAAMAIAAGIVFIFLSEEWYFWPLLIGIIILYAIILSLGILFMQFNYFLPAVTKLNSPQCLLTFDDGPDPDTTPQILDILKNHYIGAVFFVIGEKAEQHPEIVERIIEEGHTIGNHSYSHHLFMSMFSRNRLRSEIDNGQNTIEKITGYTPTLFRPPIGYTNPKYATVLRERKMKCIGWTLRSYDSVAKESEQLAKRLVEKIKPGHIVLLHDNLTVSADALAPFIEQASANGIKFAKPEDVKVLLNA